MKALKRWRRTTKKATTTSKSKWTKPSKKLSLDAQQPHSDGVFTLTVAKNTGDNVVEEKKSPTSQVVLNKPVFLPHIRRSAHLQFHKGILYMLGGKYEDSEDREYTFSDMCCLNVKKLDEWKVLIDDKKIKELEMNVRNESSGILLIKRYPITHLFYIFI